MQQLGKRGTEGLTAGIVLCGCSRTVNAVTSAPHNFAAWKWLPLTWLLIVLIALITHTYSKPPFLQQNSLLFPYSLTFDNIIRRIQIHYLAFWPTIWSEYNTNRTALIISTKVQKTIPMAEWALGTPQHGWPSAEDNTEWVKCHKRLWSLSNVYGTWSSVLQ